MAKEICKSHLPDGSANPEWLEKRKTGVTATDAAKLLSGGSWIHLWSRKTGRIESEDLSDNEFVRWGSKLEPVIIEAYGSKDYADRPTTKSGTLIQSEEHPWMLATLDALTVHPKHGTIPLEVKNNNAFRESDWEDGAPEPYLWQARHQAVTHGSPAASVACLLGGNRLMWQDDEVTVGVLKRVVTVTEKFYWHLVNDVPPDAFDGSKETKLGLDAAYLPEPGKRVALGHSFAELDMEYADIVAQLKQRKIETKPLEERKQQIENLMRAAMTTHAEAQLPNGMLWTQKRVDRKAYTAKASSYTRVSRKAIR